MQIYHENEKNGAKEMQNVQNEDKNRHQKLGATAKVCA